MRIASLLASATEMVFALGLGERLVAISHECDYPPEALDRPRVSQPRFDPAGLSSGAIDAAVRQAMASHGAVYELDEGRLLAARPDLILTQAVCEVCAVPTTLAAQAARAVGGGARVLSLDAHTVADIFESIRVLAAVAGVPDRGERLVASYEERLGRARPAGGGRPGVLAIEWLDPPFVPGHWVPEMIELAGGRCLAGVAGRPSREVSWDHLATLDPDVLIVMPCGFGLDRSREEAQAHAAALARVAPRAIGSGRAFVVDGSAYFNRSGPRVVDGIEILAALLHPDGSSVDLAGCAEALSVVRSPLSAGGMSQRTTPRKGKRNADNG
jgi:iron complex transport system substrate-binding protein